MADKSAFIVAFLGALISLSPFSHHLKGITIDYGFGTIKFLWLVYFSLSLLLISTYLYALDYVRYGLNFFDKFKFFRWCQVLGDSCYSLAILSPIIYLLLWSVLKLCFMILSFKGIIHKYDDFITNVVSLSLGTLSAVVSVYSALFKSRERIQIKEELLEKSSAKAENEAKELAEKGFWNASIVEAFRSLELSINKKLISLGIDSARISIARALEILLKNNIINEGEFQEIQYVRSLRNEAMHSVVKFSQEETLRVIKIVDLVLPKLEVLDHGYFENKIIDALVGYNGLFLKHHFRLAGMNKGFDAEADGPNFKYLIEIKMTRSNAAISNVFNQLHKDHRKEGYRFLIIVPFDPYMPKYRLESDIARVLFFDLQNGYFTNRDEVHSWIYKDNQD